MIITNYVDNCVPLLLEVIVVCGEHKLKLQWLPFSTRAAANVTIICSRIASGKGNYHLMAQFEPIKAEISIPTAMDSFLLSSPPLRLFLQLLMS